MTARMLLLPLFLWGLLSAAAAREHVPVLIWNLPSNDVQNSEYLNEDTLPAVSALQHISYKTLEAKYLQAFNPKNILLFLQDALSPEDLSSHVAEMHHVKQWMDEGHSLYLPSVENAAHLLHNLPSQGYNVVVLEPGSPAAGLYLKEQDNNLVVVKLPSTLTNPSRKKAIQKADEVMSNVISKIGAKRDFTVVFTSLKPSVEDHRQHYESHVRQRREVKQDLPLGYHRSSCVKAFIPNNMVFNVYKNNNSKPEQYPVNETYAINSTGSCEPPTNSIRLKYGSGAISNPGRVSVELYFVLKGDEWTVTGAEADVNFTSNANEDIKFGAPSPEISGIPVIMSYSCALKTVFRTNKTSDGQYVELVMDGLQVQPYTNLDTFAFDGAWDCVGFFSISILMSLFAAFLLVLLLAVGMFMLSDIKTMDRFDDPKGQPIMVYNAD